MAANPALTVGTGRGNALVTPQSGMLVQPVALTDASGDLANIISGSGQLQVTTGTIAAVTTLNAVTTNATGTAVDAGAALSNWTAVAVATGTPTAGTITLELSVDGVTFASSSATNSITAAGTYPIYSTGKPARYARVSLSNLSGTISLTVKMMGAG